MAADNLNGTVGALLIATLITAVGFGVTTMQTYQWYRAFPNDAKLIRCVVWSLLLLDTCHITLCVHMIYHYLILNYNNPAALTRSVWSFDATIPLTAVITCIVHGFYARRVFILGGRSWVIVSIIAVLSAMRLVFGCVVTARMLQIQLFANLPHRIDALVITGLGAGSLADWIVTGMLVYHLRRNKTGVNRTNSLIDTLTYWTINNGLLTSVVGLSVIITFIAMPYNMIYLALHLLLSKLYANSLLATLNYRQVQYARRMSQSEGGAHPLSSTRSMRADATLPYSVKDCFVPTPEVHVETTVVSDASGATAVNKRWSSGESSIDKDPSKQKTSGPGVRVDEVNEPTNESYCSL